MFNTTCGMFVPKGIKHGPNIWRDFKKPHFEMALMIGCTFKKVSANIDHLTLHNKIFIIKVQNHLMAVV